MYKSIPGFVGYSIDEYGNIRNDSRMKPVKPTKRKDGYLDVVLRVNKERVRSMVHRLVALTYVPNPDNKPQVNHIDNIRDSNHYSNLEWVTAAENIQHAARQGRLNDTSGDNHGFATLTNEQVHEICKRIVLGESLTRLAEEFGSNVKTLSNIRTGKRWTSISSQYDLKYIPKPKLTKERILAIKADIDKGLPAKEVATLHNISVGSVRNVSKRNI